MKKIRDTCASKPPKTAAKKEYKNKSNTRNNMEEPKFTLVISKVLLVRLKNV